MTVNEAILGNEDKKALGSYLEMMKRLKSHSDGRTAFAELFSRYSESHRAYHNLAHIKAMLAELKSVRDLATKPNAIEFAIWYHDAIYDTRGNDNEEQSATLALNVASQAGLTEDFRKSVEHLILATKHTANPVDADARLLVDIDLAILGQSEERFDKYEREIREEYGWVSEKDFIAGRSAVLKSFIDRATIYST